MLDPESNALSTADGGNPPSGARSHRAVLLALLPVVATIVALCMVMVDRTLAEMLWPVHTSWAAPFIRTVSVLGDSAVYFVGAGGLAAICFLAARRVHGPARAARLKQIAWQAAFVFLTVLASGLLQNALKVLFGKTRPKLFARYELYGFDFVSFDPQFWSFPSGHTITIVSAVAAIYLVTRRYLFALAAVAIVVASTRMLLSEHYLSDVLFSAYLAVAVALALKHVFLRHRIPAFPERVPR